MNGVHSKPNFSLIVPNYKALRNTTVFETEEKRQVLQGILLFFLFPRGVVALDVENVFGVWSGDFVEGGAIGKRAGFGLDGDVTSKGDNEVE